MNIKAYIVLDLLIILLLASCGKSTEMRQLLEHTDSLNSEYAPLDTVSYMEKVAGYYDHWYCSDTVRLRAYYLLASVERDRGDSPLSIEHFNKAISFADTASADCDYRQVSKIYAQIALLFHKQQYPQKELEVWEKAANYAQLANDTLLYLICQDRMDAAYWTMGNRKQAIAKAQQTYSECLRLGYYKQASSSLPTLFSYHIQIHDYEGAKKEMDEYTKMSGFFDDMGKIQEGRELFYYYQGQYYEGIGKQDSALWFYRLLLTKASGLLEKEKCYKGLMSVYQRFHQADSVLKYSKLFAETNDEANRKNSANEVSRAQALYDYSNSQRIAKEKTNQLYVLSFATVLTVIFLLSVILGIFVSIKRQKESNRRKFDDVISNYSKAMHELEQLRADHQEYEQEKIAETERLRNEVAILLDKRKKDTHNAYMRLNEQHVVKQFRKYASRSEECSSENDWADLLLAVRTYLPDFYNFLLAHQSNIASQEFRVCVLTKLQFMTSEIVYLLGTSSSRISNIRNKMNMKLFNKSGSKSFDANILRV